MNKKVLTSIFCITFSLNNYARSSDNQRVDLSSVECFFVLESKISSGRGVDEDDWNVLFNTSGYKISATSAMRKKIIKEMMLVAYMGISEGQVLRHFW